MEDKTKRAEQLRLAAQIIEDGLSWQYWEDDQGEWISSTIVSLEEVLGEGYEIRIKSTEFPPLAEGQKYWNPVNWPPEKFEIEEGWRPLLVGEKTDQTLDQGAVGFYLDSIFNEDGYVVWRGVHGWTGICAGESYRDIVFRTKRPLPKPKIRVPLGPKDVPPGSVLRNPSFSEVWSAVVSCYPDKVYYGQDGSRTWESLMEVGAEIKRPGEDWRPFWKEIDSDKN